MGTVDTGTSAVIPQPYTLPGGKAEVFILDAKFIVIVYDPGLHKYVVCYAAKDVRDLNFAVDTFQTAYQDLGYCISAFKLMEV